MVDPERTPSGYRKFYEGDIERLRWVLRQQRDAFLPLKVIEGRLDESAEAYPNEAGIACRARRASRSPPTGMALSGAARPPMRPRARAGEDGMRSACPPGGL